VNFNTKVPELNIFNPRIQKIYGWVECLHYDAKLEDRSTVAAPQRYRLTESGSATDSIL